MAGENLVRTLQIIGAALGIPAAAAGSYAAYQNYFSTDETCHKLRINIISVMERNVAPETKRSLLRKDVTEFDKVCGESDPDARAIFQAALTSTDHAATADAGHGPAEASGAHAESASSAHQARASNTAGSHLAAASRTRGSRTLAATRSPKAHCRLPARC
jgi:hypothetical protein